MQDERDGEEEVEDRAVPWIDRLGDALFDAVKRQMEAEPVREPPTGRTRQRCTGARNRAK